MKRLVSVSITLGMGCIFTSFSDASLVRFDVVPAFAPNGASSSPSWNAWVSNAIAALIDNPVTTSGDQSIDPTAYELVDPSSPTAPTNEIRPSRMMVTSFNSWMGNAPGAFSSEFGNRVHFGFALETNGRMKVNIADLDIQWTKHWMNNDMDMETSSIIVDPITVGSFGDRHFSDALVGIDYGADGALGGVDDTVHTSGDADVDAIYYVGVGDGFEPVDVPGATDQEEINLFVHNLLAADHPPQQLKTTYAITFDSTQVTSMSTIFTTGFTGPSADFDGDGDMDNDDVDALVGEIVAGTNESTFDISADGIVNNADLSQWLRDAATNNGFNAPYLLGDANLNGSVDSGDLNNLALSWRQNVALWSAGDFNADGVVNAADLNELAINWRESIPSAASVVPEPAAATLAIFALAAMTCLRRRTIKRTKTQTFAPRLGHDGAAWQNGRIVASPRGQPKLPSSRV